MATTPSSTKDRITCHVLDTTAGVPARNMRVVLEGAPATATATHEPKASLGGVGSKLFESQTDADGRVRSWLPFSDPSSSGEIPVYTLEDVLRDEGGAPTRWTLRFDVAAYFGGDDKTFFPEVAVSFFVKPGETYHVPLLLSPYSYTTYRGS